MNPIKHLATLTETRKVTPEVALAVGLLLVLSLIVGAGGLVAFAAVEIFRSHATQLIELTVAL